jgi:hypothetical protein
MWTHQIQPLERSSTNLITIEPSLEFTYAIRPIDGITAKIVSKASTAIKAGVIL